MSWAYLDSGLLRHIVWITHSEQDIHGSLLIAIYGLQHGFSYQVIGKISKYRLSKIEEDLLPTTLTISQAFDAAFYCQSLGGKFKDLYRHGELKSCSEHWGDFWFALKMYSTREPIKSGKEPPIYHTFTYTNSNPTTIIYNIISSTRFTCLVCVYGI